MTRISHNWAVLIIVGALVTFCRLAVLNAQPQAAAPSRETAIDVVKAYLRATRARDFETAYRYIASPDRAARDKNTHVRAEGSLSGFALDLARRLAAEMDVWVIDQKVGSTRAHIEAGYRAPTGEEISSYLADWNTDKLNALSPTEQTALIQALEKLQKSGKMIAIEGRETFALILEQTGWKVFLNWRSQQRVLVKAVQRRAAEVAVTFLRNDFLVKQEEPFQVDFKVTNRTHRAVVVKVDHLFQPRQAEKNIDMIACGSLVPFSLRPQETQEISSAYLLRGNVRRNQPLEIIYDFKLAPAAGSQRLSQMNVTTAK